MPIKYGAHFTSSTLVDKAESMDVFIDGAVMLNRLSTSKTSTFKSGGLVFTVHGAASLKGDGAGWSRSLRKFGTMASLASAFQSKQNESLASAAEKS